MLFVRKGGEDAKHVDIVYNKSFRGEMKTSTSFEVGCVLSFIFVL